jgi:hypothetical protein
VKAVSPKAQGAWLGAGAGSAISNIIIGIIQTDITHHALSASLVSLIYLVIPPLVAYLAAHALPALPSSLVHDVELQVSRENFQRALERPTLERPTGTIQVVDRSGFAEQTTGGMKSRVSEIPGSEGSWPVK